MQAGEARHEDHRVAMPALSLLDKTWKATRIADTKPERVL